MLYLQKRTVNGLLSKKKKWIKQQKPKNCHVQESNTVTLLQIDWSCKPKKKKKEKKEKEKEKSADQDLKQKKKYVCQKSSKQCVWWVLVRDIIYS